MKYLLGILLFASTLYAPDETVAGTNPVSMRPMSSEMLTLYIESLKRIGFEVQLADPARPVPTPVEGLPERCTAPDLNADNIYRLLHLSSKRDNERPASFKALLIEKISLYAQAECPENIRVLASKLSITIGEDVWRELYDWFHQLAREDATYTAGMGVIYLCMMEDFINWVHSKKKYYGHNLDKLKNYLYEFLLTHNYIPGFNFVKSGMEKSIQDLQIKEQVADVQSKVQPGWRRTLTACGAALVLYSSAVLMGAAPSPLKIINMVNGALNNTPPIQENVDQVLPHSKQIQDSFKPPGQGTPPKTKTVDLDF